MPLRTWRLFLVVILFAVMGSPAVSALPTFISPTFAQTSSSTINLNAQNLVPRATVFISPSAQTVLQGSTFDVSIYLNTQGNSANTLDLSVQFPPDKLAIVSPSSGTSLIQIWLKPPTYSNTDGTAQFTGIIPNGIVTQSGLITTITFKALAPGNAAITISPDSSVLANDGLGTQMNAEFGRGDYTITPQPPGGVAVFSPTHPFQSQWYNNPNPVIEWQKDPGVTDFDYVFDNQPNTVPADAPTGTGNNDGDTQNTTGTSVAYQNLGDGLWYFHIMARKLGVWSAPTNFLVQIDTQPPAAFTPAVDLIGNSSQPNKALISFFTTDALSGIDHYEVATIDNNAPAVASPVFVQTESPYQLSVPGPGSYHVIVRAFDRAGNVRDASLDVTISVPFIQWLQDHDMVIIIALLLLIIFLFLLHYFFGHKILRRVHRTIVAIEHANEQEKLEEAEQIVEAALPALPPSDSPPPGGAQQQ